MSAEVSSQLPGATATLACLIAEIDFRELPAPVIFGAVLEALHSELPIESKVS